MRSSATELDFGSRAERYDELRPTDANWWEVLDVLVREADLRGRRVLDVGCGTGQLSAALAEREGCRVWGADPSPNMLAVARRNVPRGVGLKRARAEALPFADGWFERAVMRLVVHLVDRPRAFAEAARVLGAEGRLAIATFDPGYFEEFWLNALFPSMEGLDRARFSSGDALVRELEAAGFGSVRVGSLSQRGSHSREDALERIRGRHISTFDLLSEDEYRAGLARAEQELPERVDYAVRWLIVVAER